MKRACNAMRNRHLLAGLAVALLVVAVAYSLQGHLAFSARTAVAAETEMPVEQRMKWYDVWGTEQTYNHMSAGWSWAFDTPFTWFKQNASKLGGVRQNMALSWPARIKDQGGLREHFCHVIDVLPTVLEVAGIAAPETVDGIPQAPIEGTSFAYTFDKANAKEPTRHKTQYFEMFGQWALYHEGWLLSTKVNHAPWEAFGAANPDHIF